MIKDIEVLIIDALSKLNKNKVKKAIKGCVIIPKHMEQGDYSFNAAKFMRNYEQTTKED